ncbi:putative spliced leader RNA PSE-promoter transcription factor [Trypanosoma vivax]|nr:putative spliced leader RNA PSE-promoter transcription factor [Trypanosoma vivax]
MPAKPDEVHCSLRSSNRVRELFLSEMRLKKQSEKRGSITLSSVSSQRTVGDAFRVMLECCEKEIPLSTKCITPIHERKTSSFLCQDTDELYKPTHKTIETSSVTCSLPDTSLLRDCSISHQSVAGDTRAVDIRIVDSMWSLLDSTPLDSPVHGILALRGKSIVESVVAEMVEQEFPRLRSKHLQCLIHQCCGLLPCSRIALRLGFIDFCGLNGEVGMWRELNVLTQRFNAAKRNAACHLQRIEKGVPQQRRWYWKGVLRSSARRLKYFPIRMEDIRPRMEWIRASLFAFIGFLEMAENSGDLVKVRTLVKKLFCSQFVAFTNTQSAAILSQQPLGELTEKTSSPTCSFNDVHHCCGGRAVHADRNNNETQETQDFSNGCTELSDAHHHPMNIRADNREQQFTSSGGAHAVQCLRDDIADDYRAVRHLGEAPPILFQCIEPKNALKEIQIILRHDPNISPSLSSAPIDVDQAVRRITEVHETNPYATLYNAQQFKQTEYTICRLYAGKNCIGQGKGETLMEAMHESALHALLNYYLKRNPIFLMNGKEYKKRDDSHTACHRDPFKVHMVKRVDEEIVL